MSFKQPVKYRLGIDLGTNSLGWCALVLDERDNPYRILAMGSRIFGDGRDPKSKASLAIDRRAARAMRRRRDRLIQRRDALIDHLITDGLLPDDAATRKGLEGLDPYALRAAALDGPLPPYHLGRAFFHLNQRRGFKSNRKTDRKGDAEAGKIAVAIDRLDAAMREDGARTLGEFLHRRRLSAPDANHIPGVRARLRPETGEDAKGDGYDFYPSRAQIEDEFDAIWDAQAPHHPTLLTEEVRARLHEIVFFQRPLKALKIGVCTLLPPEPRLPKAHPLFQHRRLLEEVNALEIVQPGGAKEKLTLEQRDLLLNALRTKQKVTFQSLRKTLKLDPDARFNKESDNRPHLLGDEIYAQFFDKKRFGNRWAFFSADEQWAILSRLRDDEDEAALGDWLVATYDLSDEQRDAILGAHLPEGYGRFGLTATRDLIAELEKDVIVYSAAVVRAGLGHHSDFRVDEPYTDEKGYPALPYYGVVLERHLLPGTGDPADDDITRIGRITNPTVHIGLGQLRRVINRLIRRYGVPHQIAIELARDLKLSEDEKTDRNRQNTQNRRDAEARSDDLRKLGDSMDTGANRALLKLWQEQHPNALDRRCIYSGAMIGIEMLFNGSVEVDHILPISETLDDTNANKILCLREANRLKRRRTPFQAREDFAIRYPDGDWDSILARVAHLPKNKQWRFQEDALDRFREEEGFFARQLVDTQYLSRLAREYLSSLYPGKGEGSSHLWVSPGRLTEIVRRKLGLNELVRGHNLGGGAGQAKNRLNHRHHAMDAFVIAIIDRSLLQRMATESGKSGAAGVERLMVPDPWDGFRAPLERMVNQIIVSHRADHGTAAKTGLKPGQDRTAGRLHNDTAYGLTGEKDARGNDIVVHRVPITALKPADLDPHGTKGVRDPQLRAALAYFTAGAEGKAFEARLRQFRELGPLIYRGIRRVRVVEPLTVIPIKDRTGKVYKGYKGDSNYRYDVWEMPDGKWVSDVVTMFDAHQPGWTSPVRAATPTARKVLSLRQDDLIAIAEEDGTRHLMRVVKFDQRGSLTVAEPQEGGSLKERDAAKDDPFKYRSFAASSLKKQKARQVRIDELGRVQDPGFPARKRRRATRHRPPAV